MNSSSPFSSSKPSSEVERQNQARTRLKVKIFCALGVNVAVLLALLLTPGCKREQPQAIENSQPIFTETAPPDMAVNDPTNVPGFDTEPTTTTNDPGFGVPPQTEYTQTPPPITTQPPPVTLGATKEYKIKAGDTFYSIGKEFGVSMNALKEANPTVDPSKLQIGKAITIPASSAAPAATTTAAPTASAPTGFKIHEVKSGDTLSSLATKYGTTIKAIQTANGMTDTRIKVGQKLKIPAK